MAEKAKWDNRVVRKETDTYSHDDKSEADLLRESQAVIRLNEQCYLMDHLGAFSAQGAKINYSKFPVYTGDPWELRKKLSLEEDLLTFMELKEYQLSALMPVVKLFLVDAAGIVPTEDQEAGKGGIRSLRGRKSKEVSFQQTISSKTVQSITASGQGTLKQCWLEEFYYEEIGTNEDGAGQKSDQLAETRKVGLKFSADSLAALDYKPGDDYASVLDMLMSRTAGTEIAGRSFTNQQFFMVRVAYGWMIPEAFIDNFSSEQKKAIEKSITQMILHVKAPPKINFSEDGRVDIELEYMATVELDPDNSVNALADGSRQISSRLADQNMSETDAAEKIVKANAAKKHTAQLLQKLKNQLDKENVKEYFKTDEHGQIQGEPIDAVNWAAIQGLEEGDISDKFQYNEYEGGASKEAGGHQDKSMKKAQVWEMIRKAQQSGKDYVNTRTVLAQLDAERMQLYSDLIVRLIDNNRVWSIAVPKSELGITSQEHLAENQRWTTHEIERKKLAAASAEHNSAEADARFAALKKISESGGTMRNSEWKRVAYTLYPDRKPYEIEGVHQHGVSDVEIDEKQRQGYEAEYNRLKKEKEERKAVQEKQQPGGRTKRKANVGSGEVANEEVKNNVKKATAEEIEARKHKAQGLFFADDNQETLKGGGTLASTGYVKVSESNPDFVKFEYVYFGAIIETLIEKTNIKLDGTPRNPHLILGSIQYSDPGNHTRTKSMPIADIPISFKLFRAWIMSEIIIPQRDTMTLNEFIKSLLNKLLRTAFAGGEEGCFVGRRHGVLSESQNPSALGFVALGDQRGNNRIPRSGRFGTAQLDSIPKSQSTTTFAQSKNEYEYVVFNCLYGPVSGVWRSAASMFKPAHREQENILNGIYPIAVRSSVGPVKSISFTQHTAGGPEAGGEVFSGATNKNITQRGYDGTFFNRYDTTVKMVGNNLFKVGGKCDILTSDIGDVGSRKIAKGLGFGGYSNIYEVRGTINSSGWEIEVKTSPADDLRATQHVEDFVDKRSKNPVFEKPSPKQQLLNELAANGIDINDPKYGFGPGGFDYEQEGHRNTAAALAKDPGHGKRARKWPKGKKGVRKGL